MMRLAMVCAAVGSVIVLAGCSGSSSDGPSGAAGSGQSAGGAGQTAGGAGQTAGGAGQTSGGAGQTSGGASQTAGGSTGSGTFTTSVPGSTVLGSLTDDQANTLCMDLSNSAVYTSINDFSCRTTGILAALLSGATTDAAIQAACTTAYTQCTASPGTVMCDQKPTSACMATVAEYEACVNDEESAITTLSAQIPMCSALTAANLESSLGGTTTETTPASCDLVQQKCPEFEGSDM